MPRGSIGLTATPPLPDDRRARPSCTRRCSAPWTWRCPRPRWSATAPWPRTRSWPTSARPTPAEADYIHGEAVRFAELRADLLDPAVRQHPVPGMAAGPGRGPARAGGGAQVSWQRFEQRRARRWPTPPSGCTRPGCCRCPTAPGSASSTGARPTADDWVALIGDYCRHCLLASDDPRDEQAYEAIRRALPSVGYRLTRAGVRAGESPVDRVLARSASKARAVTEILRAESAELGTAAAGAGAVRLRGGRAARCPPGWPACCRRRRAAPGWRCRPCWTIGRPPGWTRCC